MPRCIRPVVCSLAVVLVAVGVSFGQVGPVGLQMEVQNWWKTTSAGTGVLTVARAQDYEHVHFRTTLPAQKVYPAGTPFTPQATLILHHAIGQVQDLIGPMVPGGRDITDWPVPPSDGSANELITVRTYPDQTTPSGGASYVNTVTFETPPLKQETRRVRIYNQLGREGVLRIATWMTRAPFNRGYINLQLPTTTAKAATTGVSGTWQFRFVAWGASGAPTFNGSVLIDPNFHAASNQLGTIGWQSDMVTSDSNFQHVVNVDTTQLANGVHRIAVIVDDEGHSPFPGSMASVLQVWFTVQN
jgi:hypothetical protein